MAPPSPRRPGFSKRAQYGLFAGYVVAVAGALLALLLILTARFDPDGNSAMRGFLGDIFSPISSAGRGLVRSGQAVAENTGAYFDAASKNKAMADELKLTREKLVKGQVDAAENARLRRLLGIVERMPAKPVVAHLISSTGSSSRRYATISVGAGDGVRNGQPVQSPDGLVGRVVQTGRIVSRVLLITDAGNIVPVKRAKDGVPALALGNGSGALEVRPLGSIDNPFRVGDVFVTSGTGGIYAPGIPVAIAVRNGRQGTLVRPLADPAALDFAMVLPIFVPEPPPPPNELPQGK